MIINDFYTKRFWTLWNFIRDVLVNCVLQKHVEISKEIIASSNEEIFLFVSVS